MGPTLFKYIFKDLLRIFLLASVVIAAIMSFAGLLRPLSERGLDGRQVLRVLAWLVPAMATYSLPVAALFATTFVYGRMAADNETTAVRAAGIPGGPWAGLTLPALVLGLTACLASLGLLCFIVPAANLQVEKVVYSNLARLTANEINRTKRLNFNGGGGQLALTAESAEVIDAASLPPGSEIAAGTQVVQLQNVYVLRYRNFGTDRQPYGVPTDIYSARRATAFIDPPAAYREGQVLGAGLRDEEFQLTVLLEGGMKFPRALGGAEAVEVAGGAKGRDENGSGAAPLVAAIQASQVGPISLESPVRQNTKFLDIRELYRLYRQPELGRGVRRSIGELVEREQRQAYLNQLRDEATGGGAILSADEGLFTLAAEGAEVSSGGDWVRLLAPAADAGGRPIRLVQQRPGERVIVEAPAATVTAEPVRVGGRPRVLVTMTFEDASVTIQPESEADPETTSGRTFERRALLDLPADVAAIGDKGAVQFLAETSLTGPDADLAESWLRRQQNAVEAEIYARWSFATACLLLPLAGGLLGMLFRSGNFLTAFAVSVVPAMLSIVLIVVGQHVAENVPARVNGAWNNPMLVAQPLIWAGNVVVLAGVGVLLWRQRRA